MVPSPLGDNDMISLSDKNTEPLSHVREQLKAADASLHRLKVSAGDVQLKSGRLAIPGHVLDLDENGYGVLARAVRPPAEYLKRLGHGLRHRVLAHPLDETELPLP